MNFSDFVQPSATTSQRLHIHVRKNGDFLNKRTDIEPFSLEPEWEIEELLRRASKHIDLYPEAISAYTEYGDEIQNCLLIEPEDKVFLVSKGERFLPPPDHCSTKNTLPARMGKYSVGKLLGIDRLGMHVAIGDNHNGERVVLKFFPKRNLRSVEQGSKIQNEIECLQKLSHPHILKLLARVETRDFIVLELELLEAGDLRRYLIARKGPLKEYMAKKVLRSIISAVSFMHVNKVVHKSLNLDNLVIRSKNDLKSVQLSGFHLSERVRSMTEGLKAPGVGALPYMSPEATEHYNEDPDHPKTTAPVRGGPVDVWALGVVAFALITGYLPFGPKLEATGPPSPTVETDIKRNIMTIQYHLDESISDEMKGFFRAIFQLDPEERPDIIACGEMLQPTEAELVSDQTDFLSVHDTADDLALEALPHTASSSLLSSLGEQEKEYTMAQAAAAAAAAAMAAPSSLQLHDVGTNGTAAPAQQASDVRSSPRSKRASFLSLDGIKNVIGDVVAAVRASRSGSFMSLNTSKHGPSAEDSEEASAAPRRKESVLGGMPLFGGWRGDKGKGGNKSKSSSSLLYDKSLPELPPGPGSMSRRSSATGGELTAGGGGGLGVLARGTSLPGVGGGGLSRAQSSRIEIGDALKEIDTKLALVSEMVEKQLGQAEMVSTKVAAKSKSGHLPGI